MNIIIIILVHIRRREPWKTTILKTLTTKQNTETSRFYTTGTQSPQKQVAKLSEIDSKPLKVHSQVPIGTKSINKTSMFNVLGHCQHLGMERLDVQWKIQQSQSEGSQLATENAAQINLARVLTIVRCTAVLEPQIAASKQ